MCGALCFVLMLVLSQFYYDVFFNAYEKDQKFKQEVLCVLWCQVSRLNDSIVSFTVNISTANHQWSTTRSTRQIITLAA